MEGGVSGWMDGWMDGRMTEKDRSKGTGKREGAQRSRRETVNGGVEVRRVWYQKRSWVRMGGNEQLAKRGSLRKGGGHCILLPGTQDTGWA